MRADDAAGEAMRLAELRRLRIVDTEPEADFDLIVRAAAALFNVPIALVTLVDGTRQWFKAAHGLDVRETLRELAFCAHAIRTPGEVMIVPNATLDERFVDNALVTGYPEIRFYAGAPLLSRNGYALGTLCVIDHIPRVPSDGEISALASLATLATRLIERRIELDEPGRAISLAAADAEPSVVVFGWDSDARVSSWNRVAESVLGWSASEVMGRFPPFILPADAERYRSDCLAALAGSEDVTRFCALRTKAGQIVQVALGTARVIQSNGPARGLTTVENLDARLSDKRRLAMLESVVVHSNDAVIVTEAFALDGQGRRIVYVNDAFTRMTGYRADEAIGRTPRMLQGPMTDASHLELIARALDVREPVVAELTNYRKDGTPFRVEFSISPVLDADGVCLYFVAVQRDVSDRYRIDKYESDRAVVLEMAIRNEPLATQLARIVVLLKDVIPGSLATLMLLHDDRLIAGAADPAMPAAYLSAIDGVRIGPAVGSCGTAAFLAEPIICGDIETDERWRDYRELARTAGLRACWSIPMFGANGVVIGAFALYMSRPALPAPGDQRMFEETVRFASLVIERHRDRERLERLALHDALTDLPNRKLFEQRFDAAIARARATGDQLAVGILDIDRFKSINDAFGHHTGDQLLCAIAARLSSAIREGDVIARMGGDEFFVLFADLADRSDGIAAAQRLLARFDAPFNVAGYELFARPSFGLAFSPQTSNELTVLLVAADNAMYAAKSRGGGIEFASGPNGSSALKKLDLENDLRHALDRNEFVLHYQMMFDLGDGRPVGAEALLRWNHPQLGLVAPGDFIPLAEANGTIVPIGKWVIDEASRLARTWSDAGHDAFVTVNVCALQFDEPGLVSTVVDALERHGLEPHRLHLELTESLIMRNPLASAATLLQLKALGVRIVIDDFGTGYSSLAYLQRFAFDTLKIDRAFVQGIGDGSVNGRGERIVDAVVQLSKALGVATIAEGVEDADQYAFVQSCGCTAVQGFLCARPVPAADLFWGVWQLASPAHA